MKYVQRLMLKHKNKVYVLWFNFIHGLNFVILCFGV